MELLLLDDHFNEVARIDEFSSFQWTRRYYEVGKYQLNLSVSYFKLFDEARYLFRTDTQEIAFINDIYTSVDISNNRQFEVVGNFCESLLNERVVQSEVNLKGSESVIAKKLIEDYFINSGKRKVEALKMGDILEIDSDISKQFIGKEIGKEIYAMLEEKEMSQRLRFDYLQGVFYYDVWKGLDRTQNQEENSWAIFSDNNEELTNYGYEKDDSSHKNFCYVFGNDILVEVDKTEGKARKEMYHKSSTSKKKEDKSEMSDAEYREKLYQEGVEKLESKKIIESIESNSVLGNLEYRKDYDLGDLCTCSIQELNKMVDKRIIEIKEVYEKGGVKITPKFSDGSIRNIWR